MQLSVEQRRRILAEQAAKVAETCQMEQSPEERAQWQGGDIVEY
jgi:hypothetical protein